MKLIVDQINKTIQKRHILRDVSLQMESGVIYGFAGRNGSGKTMLFRAISGLINIDSGCVLLDDKRLHKDFAVLPNQGMILENAGLYPNMTGVENLSYLAGIRKKAGKKEIREAIARVGLDPDDKRVYRKYSLGMKQRLVIAQAIMEKPDILLLDEPSNALDEVGVEEIRKVILEEKERGAIILVASHNKDDIRILADELYRVEDGQVSRAAV